MRYDDTVPGRRGFKVLEEKIDRERWFKKYNRNFVTSFLDEPHIFY